MPISIKLPPELEGKMLELASDAGMDVNQYVLEILEWQLRPGASKAVGKAERESELLEKIILGIRNVLLRELMQTLGIKLGVNA